MVLTRRGNTAKASQSCILAGFNSKTGPLALSLAVAQQLSAILQDNLRQADLI